MLHGAPLPRGEGRETLESSVARQMQFGVHMISWEFWKSILYTKWNVLSKFVKVSVNIYTLLEVGIPAFKAEQVSRTKLDVHVCYVCIYKHYQKHEIGGKCIGPHSAPIL